MSTIVTRAGKGSPLTNTEVDSNFTNLNTDKVETLASADGSIVITGTGASRDLSVSHTSPASVANGGTGRAVGNYSVYSYEVHASQVDGNDTTGDGTLINPVATIVKALTLVTGDRRTVIVHPGTYTESPSITYQFTALTGPGLLGGNVVISGTVSTNTACTISGLKMTNLTSTTASGAGNVNVLNCDISGTFTKSGTADYTLLRLTDFAAANITGAGIVDIYGGNTNFLVVNGASANVLVKNGTTVSPVLTSGALSLVQTVVGAAVTNAVTSASGTVITLANSQFLTSTLTNVAPVVLNGFYSIFNCVFDKPNSTLVATSATGGSTNSVDYFQTVNADNLVLTNDLPIAQGGTGQSTAATAITALTGAQTSGHYLRSDGTNSALAAIQAGDVTGTVAVANGGTGAITAPAALTSLGAYPAANPSGYTSNTGTVTGVTGTAPVVSSGGTAPAISMAAASAGVNGYMTGVYATKLDGIAAGATANTGTVTGVTGTAPVVSSGGTAPAISMAAASSGVNGYMTGTYATKLDGIATGATANTGTVTSVSGTGTVSGLTLSGTVTGSGSLTLGGAIGTLNQNTTGTAGGLTGFNNPTTAATANTIVYRDGSGHITGVYGFFNYLNMSHGASGTTTDTIFYSSGDDYIRKNNATGFRASLNVPTRTGGDASGTWGISITGNAATATTTNELLSKYYYNASVISDATTALTLSPGVGSTTVAMHASHGLFGGYATTLTMSGYERYGAYQISGNYNTATPALAMRNYVQSSNTWNSWTLILSSANYTSYAMPIGSSATNSVDVRAPIFYDSNNTAYYVDPASTSQLSTLLVVGDITVGQGQTSSNIYFYDSDEGTRRMHCNSNRIGFLNDGNGWGSYCGDGGEWYSDQSVRSPLFYDNNDTAYYVDPNSVSRLNNLLVNVGAVSNDNAGLRNVMPTGGSYVTGASSVAGAIVITLPVTVYPMLKFRVSVYTYDGLSFDIYCGGHTSSGYWYNTFAYMGTQNRSQLNVRFTYGGGLMYVYIGEIGQSWSYPQVFVTDVQVGYTNYEYSNWDNGWTISFNSSTYNNVSSTHVVNPPAQSVNSANPLYGSIFYDQNDTGYYTDPNSTSRLNRVDFTNLYLASNNAYGFLGTQVFCDTLDSGVAGDQLELNYSRGTYVSISHDSMRAPLFYDVNNTAYYIDPAGSTALNINGGITFATANPYITASSYFVAPGGAYFNSGTVYMEANLKARGGIGNDSAAALTLTGGTSGYTQINGSARSPLFYDSDNTGYYVDPASTSRMGTINADVLYSYGNVTAYSDERLKKDWETLPTNFVEELAKVKSGTYTRIDSGERQVGVGAQSLQAILKEAVSEKEEYLGVHYGNAALASAVELAKEVVDLRNRVAQLESLISKLIGD